MKVFDTEYFDELTARAECNPRRRQHQNIHQSHSEPCQRLFNAIQTDSYIRPHRHATDRRDELSIAVRGTLALVAFDDHCAVVDVVRFGISRHAEYYAIGVEVSGTRWHTVIALGPESILLEAKAGPFDPHQPKHLATWAPDEGLIRAQGYLNDLIKLVREW